ncbi:hypothetical protein Tco_1378580 [Tanacetum coccineum]
MHQHSYTCPTHRNLTQSTIRYNPCALPSDTVKNLKLNVNSTSPVLSARSYLTEDPQCSTQIHGSINTIAIHQSNPHNDKPKEEEQEEKDDRENINTSPSPSPDPSVSFITKKVCKLNSFFESLSLVPQSSNTEFVCIKGDDGDVMFIEIIKQDDDSHIEEPGVGENAGVGESEVEYFDIFLTRRNFTYVIDFMIIEDISSIIDPRLSQVVLGRPFVEISNMTHGPPEGVIRNEEDKRRGMEYVMSKILWFYKECLEHGPEYVTGIADEGEVTKFFKENENKILSEAGDGVIFDKKKLGSS